MAGLEFLTEIGRQGLQLAQSQMQITGQNLANVNTEGYTRQRLDVNPILPEILVGFGLGSAIKGDTLRQIREDFVDRQFWSQNSLKSQYSTEESLLEQMEGVLPADNDAGLRNMLDEFWNAWNDLANDPEGSVARTAVLTKAETLSLTFKRVQREFINFQTSVHDEIEINVREINALTKEIATLNERNPGNNFELEDQRNRLIDRISAHANVTVQRDGKNVMISISGLMVVSGKHNYNLDIRDSVNDDGVMRVEIVLGTNKQSVPVVSGELGGLLRVHNDDLPGYLAKMDALAIKLAQEVNAVHVTGYNLAGNTGQTFFSTDVRGASTFNVDAAITADPSLISSADAAGAPGNSGIARAIVGLADKKLIDSQTFDENYRSFVAVLGSRIQEAKFLKSSQEKIINNLEMRRLSVSGVSIEEEMTNMVQQEQAFVAASKLISTADELIRTLLNMV